MTHGQVTPETPAGHATRCDNMADKFGKLAQLLHQDRVDDQCFGPIGDAVPVAIRSPLVLYMPSPTEQRANTSYRSVRAAKTGRPHTDH